MVRLTLVAVAILAFAGCKTENGAFCQTHPGQQGCTDAAVVGGPCQTDNDCTMGNLRVCDTALGGGKCVECTVAKSNACQNPEPACVMDACQKCTEHAQCPSRACMPDGTCADTTAVAYVAPGGSGTACTQVAPCKTLTDAIAAKPIVKIAQGTIADDSNNPTTIDNKAITILADAGAKLTRTKAGNILEVKNSQADVRIYDVEISSPIAAKNDTAILVSNGAPKLTLTRVKIDSYVGTGVSITAGTLTVSQCIISDNGANGILATNSSLIVTGSTISRNGEIGILLPNVAKATVTQNTININSGGGISVTNSEFDITNNFIFGNGGGATAFGGVLLNQANNGIRKFEFNTVTENIASMVTGISCTGIDSGKVLTLSNSIIFDNQIGGGRQQVSGANCQWTYSDIGDSVTVGQNPVPGTGNIVADPMFVDPTNATNKNYRLKAGSPARNTADAAATVTADFDGNSRPQDGRCDMGADEVMPTQ